MLVAATALAATACGPLGPPALARDEPVTITLAYITDLHAQLEPHPELFWAEGREQVAEAGGVARVAAVVRRLRAERPGRVLFMDGGDTLVGAAPAAWTEGASMVPALGALGLDLATPGDWEVAYGAAALARRAGELSYPLIAANVLDGATGRPLFAPCLVATVAGVRVAIVGFTDPDVPLHQPPRRTLGLRYASPDVLSPLVRGLRRQGVEVIVLLAHVGLPRAVALAEVVPGVDVVLSGGTHERTAAPIERGRAWVVEAGSLGSFLGRLDLTVQGGRVVDRRWQLLELRADRVPAEDPAVQRIVAATLTPYRARLDRVVGATSAPLARHALVETSLDDVLTDALREAAGTDVALSDGFRFGAPIRPGPIRERDLWSAYPLPTRLVAGRVTGRQLRAFWERALTRVFSRDPANLVGDWAPRVAGMSVRFRAGAGDGRRLRSLAVGGAPVEDTRHYTVVAAEGDGDPADALGPIAHARGVRVLEVDAHEAVRRYLARHRPLAAPAGGRVVAVDLPGVPRSQTVATGVAPLPRTR
jgi:2',3'-cyclic-nucleotide 2'-phosphodiesterase (5'-nucleotidase family)